MVKKRNTQMNKEMREREACFKINNSNIINGKSISKKNYKLPLKCASSS